LKSFHSLALSVLAICFVFCGLADNRAFADETSISSGSDDLRISISPGVQRAELDPGAVYRNNITVTNESDRDTKFQLGVEPYSVEGTDYAPVYTVRNAHTQITNWVTFDEDEVEIPAHNSRVIEYTVTVPYDAPGGGQYAALFAETQNDDATAILPSASAGTILIAKVSGETRETGEVKESNISKFLLAPPVVASAVVENTGNVDAEAKMSIKIENYFSGEVIYDGSGKPVESTILPGTTRRLEFSWSNVPRLGVLKVTQTVEFINDAEIKTRTVFICPVWFIALIILIILAIIFRIVAKKREDKKTRKNSKNSEGGSGNFNL